MKSIIILLLSLCATFAQARDNGQWENIDPATREWFRTLMMPDAPNTSCCGEADGYWCDGIRVTDSKTFCIITDDRDNVELHRTPVPLGTEIEIPDRKLMDGKKTRGNPTGHSIVFLSSSGIVYCFIMNGGT